MRSEIQVAIHALNIAAFAPGIRILQREEGLVAVDLQPVLACDFQFAGGADCADANVA